MSRKNLSIESAASILLLFLLVLLFQASPFASITGRLVHTIIPLTCVLLPWGILTMKQEPFPKFGLHLGDLQRSLTTGLLASLLLLIPYFLLFSLWFERPPIHTSGWEGVSGWLKMSFYQICYVAIPEEFFFRGYLQTRFNQMLGKPHILLGVQTGWGLFLTAAVFTLFHFVFAVNFWTIGILIPALIFGWLREKTGSIAASIIFHALSNIALFTFQGRF